MEIVQRSALREDFALLVSTCLPRGNHGWRFTARHKFWWNLMKTIENQWNFALKTAICIVFVKEFEFRIVGSWFWWKTLNSVQNLSFFVSQIGKIFGLACHRCNISKILRPRRGLSSLTGARPTKKRFQVACRDWESFLVSKSNTLFRNKSEAHRAAKWLVTIYWKFHKSEHSFWSNQQILLRIVQNSEKNM